METVLSFLRVHDWHDPQFVSVYPRSSLSKQTADGAQRCQPGMHIRPFMYKKAAGGPVGRAARWIA